jgi:membrane-bound ClpP family serine protease
MAVVIILILIGLFLFLVEFLLIPGITIAGIGGVAFLIGGIVWAYTGFGNTMGHITLICTLAATFFTIAMALRTRTWKRFMLNTNIEGSVADTEAHIVSPGDEGVTISRLTPMGKARFHDTVYEVKSTGNYIDQKTEIVALRIEGTKIIVKPKTT